MTAPRGPRWWTVLCRATELPLRARILVMAHAGAAPNALRALVVDQPADVEVLGLTLPGRERRAAEPAGADLAEVIASLGELRERPSAPTIVFGHSVGALLALRVADVLGSACHGVVVSGQTAGTGARWVDRVDSEEGVVALLEATGGTPADVLDDPGLRQMVLAAVLADLRLGAQAAAEFGDIVVDAPLYAIVAGNDPLVPADQVHRWAIHTRGEFEATTIPGDHFALLSDEGGRITRDVVQRAVGRIPRDRSAVLICLPFGGGGAGYFKAWQPSAPPGLTVRGMQLPGREQRVAEPAATGVDTALSSVMDQVMPLVDEYDQVAVFGHSLGAILAFELARRLERLRPGRLSHVFVSGSPGPHHPRTERATGLPDEAFIAQVRRFAGHHDAVLDDPEMRELLLPTLRADVQMHETYRVDPAASISTPLTVIRGRDDQLVSPADCETWAQVCVSKPAQVEFPGAHMYLMDHAQDVLALVRATLTGAADEADEEPEHE